MSEKESKKLCPYCGNWFKDIEKHKQKCKGVGKGDGDLWFDNMVETNCDKQERGEYIEDGEFKMAILFYLQDIRNALFKLLELKDDKK